MTKSNIFSQNLTLISIFILGIIMWHLDTPNGLEVNSWHLFVIFICTVIGIILNPLPMAAITTLSVLILSLTQTLTFKECLSGFGDEIVWLIVFAFFISKGFINTGLGNRIAYNLIYRFGHNTLGLAYSLVFTDLILSPSIPSVTARGGGILFPIASSLSNTFSEQDSSKKGSRRNGGFFMAICMQSNVITSSMFITAMAANPVVIKLASFVNIEITWFEWALAALVPGLASLIIMPLVMYYYLYPPAIKTSEAAPLMAKKQIEEMGPVTRNEYIMLLIFGLLIFSWIFGKKLFGITAATTALMGYSLLLLTRLLKFEESINSPAAWNTFLWFAHLTMMSGFLAKLGIMGWLESNLKILLAGLPPTFLIIALSLVYFYIHYIFASATAHVTVFFPTFLLLFISAGIDGKIAALILAFLSILSSGLTHFGLASAPIFFGQGYVSIQAWFRIGFLTSILYIVIWSTLGSIWWRFIGFL